MFHTFTGSSRKPRNVNLSGQKSDPWASSWSPSVSGASHTVSNAAAERERRKQERARKDACETIQRVWRAHRVRRQLAAQRRQEFDAIYQHTHPPNRTRAAFPLLISFFSLSDATDRQRLEVFARDLLRDGILLEPSSSELHRIDRLAHILLGVIERPPQRERAPIRGYTPFQNVETPLEILILILQQRPVPSYAFASRYFAALGRYSASKDAVALGRSLLQQAVVAPLRPDQGGDLTSVHKAFLFSYLIRGNLYLVEEDPSTLAQHVSMEHLSLGVATGFADGTAASLSKGSLLWLVAHFIALSTVPLSGPAVIEYIRALYLPLCYLSADIRSLVSAERNDPEYDDSSSSYAKQTPTYISDKLKSLVDTPVVRNIATQYAAAVSADEVDHAELLAGFTLALLDTFPRTGDEIRMRLYWGDMSAKSGQVPFVKYFWNAMRTTEVFSLVVSHQTPPDVLLRPIPRPGETAESMGVQRGWRTVLLFLELYTFVLRTSDDEDFFSGLRPSPLQHTITRVQACSLPQSDIEGLTIFLKNIAFSLHHNMEKILSPVDKWDQSSSNLGLYMETGTLPRTTRTKISSKTREAFAMMTGVGFHAFRVIITTAMLLIYERDSRRPFLPDGHWLMTSMFGDMETFIPKVVEEEQRYQDREQTSDESSEEEDGVPEQPLSYDASQLAIKRRREQQRRGGASAQVGPKLEVLRNMPFVIPFETRVQIFRQFVVTDMMKRRDGNVDPDLWRGHMRSGVFPFGADPLSPHRARIRRDHCVQDAFDQFYNLGDGLKEPIQITFVDSFGEPEAGIDGGGVTKEFLTTITNDAFKPELTNSSRFNLFVANPQNLLYPNPSAIDEVHTSLRDLGIKPGSEEWVYNTTDILRRYEFLGRIVGKCMYEGILIDIAFAGFFLLRWAASGQSSGGDNPTYRANLNDLRELDEDLYRGLIRLKNYDGDVTDLGLDFTITDVISGPDEPLRTVTRPLVMNGDKIPVTKDNRLIYITRVVNHRLVRQAKQQTEAFLRGLGDIINPAWLSMFNQSELQRLVGGDSSEIDVDDLRENTTYSGAYSIGDDGEEHDTVKLFWEVMYSFEDAERRAVLKYVTSTPRAPLLGFKQLKPKFTIRDAGRDEDRLPSTSTCVNLLKLPQYTTKTILRSKLLYAVQSGAGFDLS